MIDPFCLFNTVYNFHELVVAASNNKYLEEMLRNVRTRLKIVRVTLFTGSQRKEEEVKEHEEIAIAIKERKAEEAYTKMKEHEENVLRFVKDTVLPLLFS
ncbi:MAG: FCD domain-containing protein [Sulfolobus sp.]|nr:FCD domain-containing protein [Sulfolobus sp.]